MEFDGQITSQNLIVRETSLVKKAKHFRSSIPINRLYFQFFGIYPMHHAY